MACVIKTRNLQILKAVFEERLWINIFHGNPKNWHVFMSLFKQTEFSPCHGSGGLYSVFNRGGPVQIPANPCGIYGRHSELRWLFSQYFGFLCQYHVASVAYVHSLSYYRQRR
jgi:hypothetical protein